MGSARPALLFDPALHLFGEAWLTGGYDRSHYGMQPFDEAPLWFDLGRLNVIQLVDATRWMPLDQDMWLVNGMGEMLRFQEGYLTDDAFLGRFAVMYDGEFVTDFVFDDAICQGWYDAWDWPFNAVIMGRDGKWGTIDGRGEELAPFIFDQINYFGADSAIAVYEGRRGLIDRYGNAKVPFLFDEIYFFGYGNLYMMAAAYDGRHGLIDETGQTIIPFLFEHIYNIDGNTAFAKYNGYYGIIDVGQTALNAVLGHR